MVETGRIYLLRDGFFFLCFCTIDFFPEGLDALETYTGCVWTIVEKEVGLSRSNITLNKQPPVSFHYDLRTEQIVRQYLLIMSLCLVNAAG